MPITTVSDFKIYNPQFQAGVWEGINQVVDLFNGASRNCLRLTAMDRVGEYTREAFFKNVSDLIARRDPTSTDAVTPLKLTQDETIRVKANRRVGPVDVTLDAIRKIGSDSRQISFVIGRMVGQQKAQNILNTGLLSVNAALSGVADLNLDVTGETVKTLATDALARALSKMGDRAERIVCFVMHSKPYFDLVRGQISDKMVNVADRVIYGAQPATLNRPVLVSDAAVLHSDNGSATDTYPILGLVEGAAILEETEQAEMVVAVKTGYENLIVEMQSEHAFNVGVKGFKWDTVNGGANPTDAALATATNWDKVMADNKDLAGVRIVVQ